MRGELVNSINLICNTNLQYFLFIVRQRTFVLMEMSCKDWARESAILAYSSAITLLNFFIKMMGNLG